MWSREQETTERHLSASLGDSVERLKSTASLGSSIQIKGELTGDEDLIIQGSVEGKVNLKKNNVTVGSSGRIKADIYGNVISIEGEVEGNLHAKEKIVLRQTANVLGNLIAPRVNLEEGARFKGSIDMETEEKQSAVRESASQPSASQAKASTQEKDSTKKNTPETKGPAPAARTDRPSPRA